jgi:hypothetical protein
VNSFFERLKTVKQVHFQQKLQLKDFKRFKEVVKDRIVSFYKPYLRPIVRGKESKDVEFGANAAIIAQKRFETLKKSEPPPKLPLKSKLKMSQAA